MLECTGFAFLFVKMSCREIEAAPTGQARFCQTYTPIMWHPKDTPETIIEIKERNGRWRELCGGRALPVPIVPPMPKTAAVGPPLAIVPASPPAPPPQPVKPAWLTERGKER